MLSTAAENRHNFAAPTTREIMQNHINYYFEKVIFEEKHSETVQNIAVRTDALVLLRQHCRLTLWKYDS